MKNFQPEIKYIPISIIKPNPYQPRKDFNQRALEELSQSIKAYGVIQPISVRQINEDSYELIAGERRLRASELAELHEIPAIIVDYRDKESALIALMENLQREDLNFIEEAEGYNNLIEDHGFTQQEIAEKMGKNQSTIANKLRLLKLPEDIKKDLLEHNLTERHGRALLKLADDDLKRKILEKVINNELNVNKTEALVNDILDDLTKKEESEVKQNIKSLINIRIYLNTIKKAFSAIKDTGIKAEYKEVDKGDHVEVVVKIPK
ncbi:nucleoid occlusion protein [Tissierella praeacuta]|uniref:Chromosome partitioning protein, ParB family n=1 Tax=Tissierella praeacuta DSM 18095 TaxID=1123404 RepID=A0A1M4Z0E4_9FIRM|nr:nucleoid occlusion protein [Tissierella praeacuta]MBU5257152.1 nucleoid occlusion protein [Tissierella praeacuta]TCU66245.1 ParB family chromosome partitioning protein [Tissierella praeacuta]SHF11222.1 chromosome partitioning protein, ParB family [Tissierella praeacuta DSM 18095]SUP04942.1 Nucleoid occlusion protein [Tissierella praeacuta]